MSIEYVNEFEQLFDTQLPSHTHTAMEQCDPNALYASENEGII